MEGIKIKSGFKFNSFSYLLQDEENPYSVLILDKKEKFEKGIKYAKRNGVSQIEVNLDLTANDLLLLKDVPLRALLVRGLAPKTDVSIFNEFSELEYLSIEFSAKGTIDLSNYKHLQTFRYVAKYLKIINLHQAVALKDFCVYDYKEKNTNTLPDFGGIDVENVAVYYSNIETLDALKDCKSIKDIEILGDLKLSSVDGLKKTSNSLLHFALSNCKNFENYNLLNDFKNLETIRLVNSGNMSDTSVFLNLSKLEYGYIDINIEDGKVDVLMEMPIIFKNYKHYNFKNNLDCKVLEGGARQFKRGKEIWNKPQNNI